MPADELEKRRKELVARLLELDERFEREMRARGFDPAQAENVALTSELARLYAAREEVRAELEELAAENDAET
jgi:predicted nuclease with TOPRIM domain